MTRLDKWLPMIRSRQVAPHDKVRQVGSLDKVYFRQVASEDKV